MLFLYLNMRDQALIQIPIDQNFFEIMQLLRIQVGFDDQPLNRYGLEICRYLRIVTFDLDGLVNYKPHCRLTYPVHVYEKEESKLSIVMGFNGKCDIEYFNIIKIKRYSEQKSFIAKNIEMNTVKDFIIDMKCNNDPNNSLENDIWILHKDISKNAPNLQFAVGNEVYFNLNKVLFEIIDYDREYFMNLFDKNKSGQELKKEILGQLTAYKMIKSIS